MTNIGLLSMLFIVYSKPLKFAKHYFFLRFELHERVFLMYLIFERGNVEHDRVIVSLHSRCTI